MQYFLSFHNLLKILEKMRRSLKILGGKNGDTEMREGGGDGSHRPPLAQPSHMAVNGLFTSRSPSVESC